MQNSESVLIHFGFKGSFQPFSAAAEVGVRHFDADSLIAFLRSGPHGGARPGKGVKDAPARFADLHHIPHKLQGLALAKVEGNKAVIVEVNSETDFVAKNAEFVALVNNVCEAVAANNPADLEAAKAIEVDGKSIETTIAEASGKDRKSTRLNSSHKTESRMPSSA